MNMSSREAVVLGYIIKFKESIAESEISNRANEVSLIQQM